MILENKLQLQYQYDLEYDNLIMASMRGHGQILGTGFSGGKVQLGVRTTKAVKMLGCSNLKQLIETDKLIINDYDTITEFSTFVKHGQSFQAEEGHTDDLAMCCVLFGWMTNQTYFKELTNVDIREKNVFRTTTTIRTRLLVLLMMVLMTL